MKIIHSNTPSWFFNSQSFVVDEKKLPEYQGFPSFTSPNNKSFCTSLRTVDEYSLINNGSHPQTRVGFTHMETNHGGTTSYPNSKLLRQLGMAGTADETQWTLGVFQDNIQWLNGEEQYLQDANAIVGNPNKKAKLVSLFQNSINQNAANGVEVNISIYCMAPIGKVGNLDVRGEWYTEDVSGLMEPLLDPSIILSGQVEVGCNSMMMQIYEIIGGDPLSGITRYSDYLAYMMYLVKLNRLKYTGTNKKKFFPIMWTQMESLDGYPRLTNMKRRQENPPGNFLDLTLVARTARAEYYYNATLISGLLADGMINFDYTMTNIVSEAKNSEPFGYEDTVGGILPQYVIGSETWSLTNARTFMAVELFGILAMYQISLHKDIVEASTEWLNPSFKFNNILRTGNQKEIPYNLVNKEPTIHLKYNSTNTECLVLVYNPWASNNDYKIVTVIEPITLKEIPLGVKGTKAELYRIIL